MYQFTQDWFSRKIPNFTRHLGPLRERVCHLLEIGTLEGRSATWMLEHIAVHDGSTLVCVDAREHPNLRPNLNASGRASQVQVIIGKSKDVLRALPTDRFDFVYVDGCHGQVEVLEDAVLSFRLAKRGAVICFDDYLWDDPRFNQGGTPKIAVDAFTSVYHKRIEILESGYQVWLRKLAD